MTGLATGTRTVATIVTALDDSRWSTYEGTAPRNAAAPFINVSFDSPIIAATGMCMDDQGQFRSRWRVNGFAATLDQSRALQTAIVVKIAAMADVSIEQVGQVALDTTEQPDLFMWSVVFRDYQVTDR